MKTMIIAVFLQCAIHSSAQVCYDSLNFNNDRSSMRPSRKFLEDIQAFFKFSQQRNFSTIDTSCKGEEYAKITIKGLNDGYKDTFLTTGTRMYMVDIYNKKGDLNINFGLIEIWYKCNKDAKKAYNLFRKKRFVMTDPIFRGYRPVLDVNRLRIYFTASIEDKDLAEFYSSIGINNFLIEDE